MRENVKVGCKGECEDRYLVRYVRMCISYICI